MFFSMVSPWIRSFIHIFIHLHCRIRFHINLLFPCFSYPFGWELASTLDVSAVQEGPWPLWVLYHQPSFCEATSQLQFSSHLLHSWWTNEEYDAWTLLDGTIGEAQPDRMYCTMQFQFAKLQDHLNRIPNCSAMKLATMQGATFKMVHNSQGSRNKQEVAHAANLTAIFYLQP